MSIQGPLIAGTAAKEARLSAVVIRADGRVEDLGTISYWHKNPLRRWWWNLSRLVSNMKGKRNGH